MRFVFGGALAVFAGWLAGCTAESEAQTVTVTIEVVEVPAEITVNHSGLVGEIELGWGVVFDANGDGRHGDGDVGLLCHHTPQEGAVERRTPLSALVAAVISYQSATDWETEATASHTFSGDLLTLEASSQQAASLAGVSERTWLYFFTQRYNPDADTPDADYWPGPSQLTPPNAAGSYGDREGDVDSPWIDLVEMSVSLTAGAAAKNRGDD